MGWNDGAFREEVGVFCGQGMWGTLFKNMVELRPRGKRLVWLGMEAMD